MPTLHAAQQNTKVTVLADPVDCSLQFNYIGTAKFTQSCDVAKAVLARSSINYSVQYAPGVLPAKVMVNNTEIQSYSNSGSLPQKRQRSTVGSRLSATRQASAGNREVVRRLRCVQCPGLPLVELFPTRFCCTGMSLFHHIGNGSFGGLMPATAFAMIAQTGDSYFGL